MFDRKKQRIIIIVLAAVIVLSMILGIMSAALY